METSKALALAPKIKLEKDEWEKKAWNSATFVVGIDEVGRGCFAGPVVSSAVMLPLNTRKRILKDSKVMTPAERDKAYAWIMKHCFVGIGMVDHALIDRVNIYQASMESMRRAVYNLLMVPDVPPVSAFLVDAVPLTFSIGPLAAIPVHNFIKGESYSCSIAAASIVAKVTRDRLMSDYAQLFPAYKLDEHKGYGTALHQEKIKNHGASLIHRGTFLKKLWYEAENQKQQLLF